MSVTITTVIPIATVATMATTTRRVFVRCSPSIPLPVGGVGRGYDIRVIDLSDGPRFLSESLHGWSGPQFACREDLERDVLCQMDMERLVDGAHSPFAELVQDSALFALTHTENSVAVWTLNEIT
jgi:hypothetical protein